MAKLKPISAICGFVILPWTPKVRIWGPFAAGLIIKFLSSSTCVTGPRYQSGNEQEKQVWNLWRKDAWIGRFSDAGKVQRDCMRSAVASPLSDVSSTPTRHAKPGNALPPVCKKIVGDRESAIYGQTNDFQSLAIPWGIHVRR